MKNHRVRFYTSAVIAVYLCLFSATCLRAQETAANATADPARTNSKMADASTGTLSQPRFVPMTGGQRFENYLKGLFSPFAFVSAAASAGYGQWRDRPKEWGEGDNAYAKRYVSAFSGHVVRETLKDGVAAALHEDNRYIRSGRTGFGSRLSYAIASTFLARHDDGSRGFSVSAMTGFVGGAAISRTWQPYSSAQFHNGATAFGVSVGVTAGFNVAREFLFNRR